ncbi:21082_t:CDS:2, partial [Dentiscutata erythropus]
KLVYQVHPLPDQILDYVWDYGVLKPEEERPTSKSWWKVTPDICGFALKFICMVEESYKVSLCDVKEQ